MAYQNWRPSYPPAPPQNGAGGNYYQHPPPQPSIVAVDPFRSYYADRLRQLTFNSRPLIQELSVMAMQQRDGNNWEAMKAVVEEIETAVLRVRLLASAAYSVVFPRRSLTVGSTSSKATAAIPHRLDLKERRLTLHYPSPPPHHSPPLRQDLPRSRRPH